MWVKVNPNPRKKRVGDCVIRAISIATGMTWREVYAALCFVGWNESDMPSSNEVWGLYLYLLGFDPFVLQGSCPKCVTVREFCKHYPVGTYIIGTGSHAVSVIDGDYYDTWDSGSCVPKYFFIVD